jgi:hypothetical protein
MSSNLDETNRPTVTYLLDSPRKSAESANPIQRVLSTCFALFALFIYILGISTTYAAESMFDWGCWITDGEKCSWDSAKWGDRDHVPLVGDVNGDGKADRILYRASDGNWGCWITDGEKCSWDSAKWGSADYVSLVGDVNGDGKTDRILYQASQ